MNRRSFIISTAACCLVPGGAFASADAERQYYADLAALLDPLCHVYEGNHPDWRVTVPKGEVWYVLNMWMAERPGSNAKLFHRTADVADAFQITEGFALWAGSEPLNKTSYVLYARPKVVQDRDRRYEKDPKGLYFDRLSSLRSLPIETIAVSRPQGMPHETLSKAFVPDKIRSGIVRQWECHDGSWLGMVGPTGDIINTQNERSDKYPLRMTRSTLFPFLTSMFNGIWLAGGSEGEFEKQDPQTLDGYGAMQFSQLPSDW